jgi:hypothetical protein
MTPIWSSMTITSLLSCVCGENRQSLVKISSVLVFTGRTHHGYICITNILSLKALSLCRCADLVWLDQHLGRNSYAIYRLHKWIDGLCGCI